MNKLYGITHDLKGQPLVRIPRVVKVGIGKPKGADVMVWIARNGEWHISSGDKMASAGSASDPKNIDVAKSLYAKARRDAPTLNYPRKLNYFTFSRPAGDGTFDPDFEAIAVHGPMPTSLPIMFTSDSPMTAEYQMWTTTELKCHGNGIDAQRVITMATAQQKTIASECEKNGDKYFPIQDGCATMGCQYAERDAKGATACKPHTRLQFQLIRYMRVGGVAQFDSTSYRTTSQLFSCIHQFLEFSGQGDPDYGHIAGIPFMLVLQPFRTNVNGKAGTAYSVSLEFRPENAKMFRAELIEQGVRFRQQAALTAPPKELTNGEDGPEEEETFDAMAETARAMTDEFADGEEPENKPEVASIGLNSFTASADDNRGHDEAIPVSSGMQSSASVLREAGK